MTPCFSPFPFLTQFRLAQNPFTNLCCCSENHLRVCKLRHSSTTTLRNPQVVANGVGMLDTGAETNKVEQGTKVEVPFWLAYELYIRNTVTVNVPPGFNQKTRKEIQADVGCVNLKSRCSYFDELGCKIAPMIGDITMGSFLLYAFTVYEAARSSMTAFKKWHVGGARFGRASILKKKRKPTD